jgi:hypothetical protein
MEDTRNLRGRNWVAFWGALMLVLAFTACSSDKPKPMAQPSTDQVKGSADRAFDKLKQEEKDRKPAGM